MFDETIMEQWLTERSDIALKKLLNHEPLTFEDNIVFALVGQREEMKRLEKRMNEGFDNIEKRFDGSDKRMDGLDKRMDRIETQMLNIRQDISTLTRWILTAILAVPVLIKLLDVLLAKMN